jgi:hypothetical protein
LLQGVFIDGTNTIVQEKTAQQDGQRENSNVVVGILVKCTKAFGVKNKYFDRLSFWRNTIDWFAPDPDSLNMNKSQQQKEDLTFPAPHSATNLSTAEGLVGGDLVG